MGHFSPKLPSPLQVIKRSITRNGEERNLRKPSSDTVRSDLCQLAPVTPLNVPKKRAGSSRKTFSSWQYGDDDPAVVSIGSGICDIRKLEDKLMA